MNLCRDCHAGETRIDEATHWTGRQNIVISASVKHWCDGHKGVGGDYRVISRKTREEATTRWNELNPATDEGGRIRVTIRDQHTLGTCAGVRADEIARAVLREEVKG